MHNLSTKANIVVLGGGMIGKTIAIDLSKDNTVTVVDKAADDISIKGVQMQRADLSDPLSIPSLVEEFDLVVGAVPGYMGFQTLKAVIESGKNTVDISFFAEDPFLLDELAKANGVTAVMDCGVAPGLDNIILGYHDQKMKVDFFECLVGGLPLYPKEPYNYKAPFSPVDVIEEYTRPARIRQGGEEITVEALSGLEEIEFEQVGTLEAFNSDGLRSLLTTMKAPDMIEKTLRYPGHASKMKDLREGGFFAEQSDRILGTISPLEMSSQILFDHWRLEEGEEEFTIMRVRVRGEGKEYIYTLLDRTDLESGTTSMARTTGYTCTAVCNLVLDGKYHRKGISPPEYVGAAEGCYKAVLDYLRERGVQLSETSV